MNDGQEILTGESVFDQIAMAELSKKDVWLDLHSFTEPPEGVEGITLVGEHALPKYIRFKVTTVELRSRLNRTESYHVYVEAHECNEGFTWYVAIIYIGNSEEVIIISPTIKELGVYLKLTYPEIKTDGLTDYV